MTDVKKYCGSLLRPEDVADGPLLEKIVVSEHEKHGCLVLDFESGNQLYLWPNLARVLGRAWGSESDDWLEQEVELSLGHYIDKNLNPPTEKECMNIRAVSQPKAKTGNGGTSSKAIAVGGSTPTQQRDDLDSIPF
jgi:hypothetical protein